MEIILLGGLAVVVVAVVIFVVPSLEKQAVKESRIYRVDPNEDAILAETLELVKKGKVVEAHALLDKIADTERGSAAKRELNTVAPLDAQPLAKAGRSVMGQAKVNTFLNFWR